MAAARAVGTAGTQDLSGPRGADDALVIVPCAARPGGPWAHRGGPCQCFFGGEAPIFVQPAPVRLAEAVRARRTPG